MSCLTHKIVTIATIVTIALVGPRAQNNKSDMRDWVTASGCVKWIREGACLADNLTHLCFCECFKVFDKKSQE